VGSQDDQTARIGEELKAKVCLLIDSLVEKDAERYESDFVLLLTRVQDLVDRKRHMEGSKTDTRDLVTELLFSRLRHAMHLFLQSEDPATQQRAAEWVMGSLFSITTLTEIAQAFDQVLLRSSHTNSEFNFASRTDFLSLEEVLQMLGAGKHKGCLSLEKADNRLDIYMRDGRIVFLDPHHMIRRVIPSSDSLRQREIPSQALMDAEELRARSGRPVLLCLFDAGHFRKEELREMMRLFGREVLYDFMMEDEPFVFYYRRQDDELPDYANEHDFRLGVTSVLLEGSKRVDDWRMMQQMFPDPSVPVEPRADMFARMGDVALDVLEIKLLSQINGEVTPRSLVPVLGLPLFEVYQLLVRLAREGIIASPGGDFQTSNARLSVEESMQAAFAALDANDDERARSSALDSVLGDDDDVPSARVTRSAASSVLDKLFAGDDDAEADSEPKKKKKSDERDFLSILKRSRKNRE
jgi:Domain of unknown function (DUF4388)